MARPRNVTGVIAGAFVPDLAKVDLIVPSERVAALLDWFGLPTAGGAILAILVVPPWSLTTCVAASPPFLLSVPPPTSSSPPSS